MDSENKAEYQPIHDRITGLINDNYPDPKTEAIQKIRSIINECGGFDMLTDCIKDAQEEAIIVSASGKTSILIDSFGYDGVDCTEYVNEMDTDNPSYDYEDLTLETLQEILNLADIVDVDNYKTQKRCQ